MNLKNPLHLVAFVGLLMALPFLLLLTWVFKPLAPKLAALLEPWYDSLLEQVALMAVVNTKSTTITNLDSAQVTRAPIYANGGVLKEWIETLETVNGDSIGSTYRFFRVPSWLRVSELLLDCDDIGTTTIGDIGLYKTAADGGAVVDADFFGSAVSLKDGALANAQQAHESAVVDLPNYKKRIWEQLGLTEDPKIFYDVVVTLTAAADAAGTITLRLRGVES